MNPETTRAAGKPDIACLRSKTVEAAVATCRS